MRSVANTRARKIAAGLAGLLAVATFAAEPPSSSTSSAPPAPPAKPPSDADTDALFQAGKQLFNDYAPPEVKAQYDFPTKQQWDAFAVRLQRALEGDSLEDLADYAPQARALLTTLRTLGVDDDLADWLEQRLDEVEAAQQIRTLPPPTPLTPTPPPVVGPRPTPTPAAPAPPPPRAPGPRALSPAPEGSIPHYDLWLGRVRNRPVPARAAELMPGLRSAFAAEGVPASLAWIAEAESSLNPTARSPSGAKGLFQLTPDTAHRLGLSTFLPDQRTDPEKSAHVAARYLKQLHTEFGNWPLALAAYNAGAGRVSRALASRHAKDFAGVADALPVETRMYVPKICALVAVRTGASIAGR